MNKLFKTKQKYFILIFLAFALSSIKILSVVAGVSSEAAGNLQESVKPLTLIDCYRLALKQSETIAIKQELIKEQEGRFLVAFSTMMPKVTYVWTQKREDGNPRPSFPLDGTPEGKFVFKQPLFTGFKEFAAMAGSKAETRQREQEKVRAKQLLFTDVSDAFYFYLSYQEDIDAVMTTRQALMDRTKELHKREELGRSRASEVASAEAKLSRVEADWELAVSQKEIARQLLEFLTGQTIGQISDEEIAPEILSSQDALLAKVDKRPDVIASREAWNISKNQTGAAKSKFFPAVSLEGDYYTKRVGAYDGIDWDMTLRVEAPVFQGGEYIGNYKIAKSQERQAELQFQQKRRSAVLEIQNAYTKYESSIRRRQALEKAYLAAEKNFNLQSEDYKLNLVNNLDVLTAIEDWQGTRRIFIASKNESKRSYWQFKLTIGEIPDDAR